MLSRLVVKFFIKHAKRTVRGSKIIAISLLAIFVTQILILVFSTQLTGLTNLVQSEDNYLVLTPRSNDTFPPDTFEGIRNYTSHNPRISDVFYEFQKLVNITFTGSNISNIPLHFVDLSQIIEESLDDNSVIYPTLDFEQILDKDRNISIMVEEETMNLTVIDFLDQSEPSINSGLYLDSSLLKHGKISHIYIHVVNSRNLLRVNEDLHTRFDINSEPRTDEVAFIRDSQRNIEMVLSVLSLLISFLIILGISNLTRTILLESVYDIRVLKSIGLSIPKIRLVYIMMIGLIGLVGSLLAILLGFAIPNIIFAGIAIVTTDHFIPTSTSFTIVFETLLLGVGSCILSSLVPIWRWIN